MGNKMAEYFEDPEFIQNLAYLADVFTTLNELNRSLQGQGISVIHACEKLSAFKEKLQLCIRHIKKGNLVNFPSLQETLQESVSLHPPLVSTIAEHLQILSTAFDGYFSCGEIQTCDYWIRNPFKVNMEEIDDNSLYAFIDFMEDLIDMRNNTGIKLEFSDDSLENFWASQLETYPVLAKKALTVLVPFATTYLCETRFSCLVHIKTKSRNRLDSQHNMRVALSTKTPRFDVIINRKQQQKSH